MNINDSFAREVDEGLSSDPKRLPTRFIYDDNGSRLFEEIMRLPEYYLTDAEKEIFEDHKEEIEQQIGSSPFNLVELGAGNGEKTKILLSHFLEKGMEFRYIPVDISQAAVREISTNLAKAMPHLQVKGLTMEYFEAMQWLKEHSQRKNVVLFLGSNIGNFQHQAAGHFLDQLHSSLKGEDLAVIGFDLKKDYEVIRNAYYDSLGVTKAFNMNLLERINRELGGNFNLEKIQYYAAYNPIKGRNEAYLYAIEEQQIWIESTQKSYPLEAFEPIITEYSYKFSEAEIEATAAQHHFEVKVNLRDKNNYFVDSIWSLLK